MTKRALSTFIVGIGASIAIVGGLVGSFVGLEQGFIAGLTAAMVYVTSYYVHLTSKVVDASNKQAAASINMANEMREERLAATRPMIVQKAVHKIKDEIIDTGYFSNFIICNIGIGTAIEPVIILRNASKEPLEARRRTFLKPHEEIPVNLGVHLHESHYYLDCVYQDMSHATGYKSLHRTRLPFRITKASKEGEFYLIPGELSFEFNIPEDEVHDAYPIGSKPK